MRSTGVAVCLYFFCRFFSDYFLVEADPTTLVYRNTKLGRVVGYIYEGRRANAGVFLGLPYAQPPVGELRLKYPLPVKPWRSRGDYNATYERPWCVQFWYQDDRLDKRRQSEDCLFANLVVPLNHTSPPPYPVLVWIHGGSYQVGGANSFPVNGTVENLVSRGLLVLTINYRLGPLGFMSSLNDELPGNFGLEDQLMALKWVHENIASFEGDPNNVAIAGESAGAASVSLLGVSPKSEGLIHRLMIRSGSGLSPWAVRTINTDLNTNRLISGMGCRMGTAAETMRCLRAKDRKDFKNQWYNIAQDDLMLIMSKTAHKPMNYNHPFLAHTYFTPVVDGYRMNDSLIPGYPEELVRRNAKLPMMMGTTTGECTGYVTWISFLEKAIQLNSHDLEYVVPGVNYANAEQVQYIIRKIKASVNVLNVKIRFRVKQAVYKRYIGDYAWKPGFNFRRALVQIASDQNFVAPAALEARLYAERGAPIYAYTFDHSNPDLHQKHVAYGVADVGASHGFDIIFLFQSTTVVDPGPEKKPLSWSDDDYNVTNFLADTVAYFTATGNPNGEVNGSSSPLKFASSPFRWPAYRMGCNDSVLIRTDLSSMDYHPDIYYFWHKTVAVLQTLTLKRGYSFAGEITCSYNGDRDRESTFDYKTAFFVTLAAAVLSTVLLFSACFVQLTIRRESSGIVEKMAPADNSSGCPMVGVKS